MPLYVVVEMNTRSVVAYPEQDLRVFANKETAKAFALAISADCGGVFTCTSVDDLFVKLYTRARTKYDYTSKRFVFNY